MNFLTRILGSQKPVQNPRSATYVFTSDTDTETNFRRDLERALRPLQGEGDQFPILTWMYTPKNPEIPNSANATLSIAWGPATLPDDKEYTPAHEDYVINGISASIDADRIIRKMAEQYGIHCTFPDIESGRSMGEPYAH